ncbi:MAG: phenylalanine--tRNA ligase subunit alpha [Desulfobacterales bacterium]|nr:phenylalanine--tRNA ligase subunit alpha [Desulfobacterales bacterium]
MENTIEKIYSEALSEIDAASDRKTMEALSTRYLGRKGFVTQYLKGISSLPEAERPLAGKRSNEVKKELEARIAERLEAIEAAAEAADPGIDVTLPGRTEPTGSLHPLTRIMTEMCEIFARLGFSVVEGPEVEYDYYNFEALNIPKHHPARAMQDTFYISPETVLRTHTSSTQPRVMEKTQPPVRIIAPGKVYRCDSDLTHTPMFHQVEGLYVDEKVSFGDLKGVLTSFIHQMFDPGISLRFRPSYFPFTEPSAEVDIKCVACRGKGCRICSHTGWLEILGSGMVHPAVLENAGYDTSKVSGFAFGMGVERITMLKYGVDDIRKYFENDIRFLRQF